jgi:glutathione S-transferase
MLFYDCSTAPSPRRVRIFMAEKGLSILTQQVDLRAGEHLGAAFRKINPEATVPVLLLDNGAAICDAVAICVYLEETHPEPALIGRNPEERALVIATHRQIERDGFYALMEAFRNSTPGMKGRAVPGPDHYDQIPELAARGRARLTRFFARIDEKLASSDYVAGDRYSIADITAQITLDWAIRFKMEMPANTAHLNRWHEQVSARPSGKA